MSEANAHDDDRRIVNAVRAGDVNAFGKHVSRYQGRIFNLAIGMMKDQHSAADLTQDAFITAYSKLVLYDNRRSFYPWLATIAVRLALNQLRKQQADQFSEGLKNAEACAESAGDQSTSSNPLDALQHAEDRKVWNLVLRLPAGERTAVLLVYRQELTMTEAACAMGVTTGTVKTLLHRARSHLRNMIEDNQEVIW